MKKKYDFVYLTNTPSFYKVNLCNEIAKSHSLLLVCYGYGSEAVNLTLKKEKEYLFDYFFLYEGDLRKRNKFQSFVLLCRLMSHISCVKILYAGWFVPEYNLYSFFSPKIKNVIVCESSIFDVTFGGIKGWLKRRIISRMSAVLASGKPHADLFSLINFDGSINITGGVGIFNKGNRKISMEKLVPSLNYLYVGRLVEVKNLFFLIEVFNRSGRNLTIVGDGALEIQLKKMAKPNISFRGFVENENLGQIYMEHNVFILPSIYEPWGLVIDEAIYWGLPVLVSDRVGCSIDLVKDMKTGCLFDPYEQSSLLRAIDRIERNYLLYKESVKKVDFEKRDVLQVKAYTNLLFEEAR